MQAVLTSIEHRCRNCYRYSPTDYKNAVLLVSPRQSRLKTQDPRLKIQELPLESGVWSLDGIYLVRILVKM